MPITPTAPRLFTAHLFWDKKATNTDDLNSFLPKGLPPGPIASPGLKSIKAALFPAKVSYLYFVSKNDGSHYFSSTNAQHSQAVLKYQRSKENTISDNGQEKTN